MKIALLSDIHGNQEALTAVLRAVEESGVDEIYCLGDVVGYGCDPHACLELIEKHAAVKLMGNHESVVLGLEATSGYTNVARIAAEWTRESLSDQELSTIARYEMVHELGDITFVHASPFEPENWHYILTADEADIAFEHMTGAICFHGHTHIPQIFSEVPGTRPKRKTAHDFDPFEESRYLVNVGSVGQPRDNDPRACFVTMDLNTRAIRFHRVEYDIAAAQKKMTAAELPELLIDRLAVGR